MTATMREPFAWPEGPSEPWPRIAGSTEGGTSSAADIRGEVRRARLAHEADAARASDVRDDKGLAKRAPTRPEQIGSFVGQRDLVRRLKITIGGAVSRGEAPGHILISGPAGFGKTSLARIVAAELGCSLVASSGMSLRSVKDLAGILQHLEAMSVLFVDEIHRLPIAVEEMLYEPLEDGTLTLTVGRGPQARPTTVSLPPFVLVGATTAPGKISDPMRDRFAAHLVMAPYTEDEIAEIVARAWDGWRVAGEAAVVVSKRSKGVPRVSLRLARMVMDVASLLGEDEITEMTARTALDEFGIGEDGLDEIDHRLLTALVKVFGGGPVGLANLAKTLDLDESTIEAEHEGWLIRRGLMVREASGRIATPAAFDLVESWSEQVPWGAPTT